MISTLGILATCVALSGPGDPASGAPRGSADPRTVQLDRCLVSLIEEVEVPAREAGVLVALDASEGMHVEAGMRLGQIADAQAQAQLRVKQAEYDRAKEQAENDINVRYAQAAAKVAEADYQQAVEANQKVPGAVPQADVRRLLLNYRKAMLQIEQASFEQSLARLTSQARLGELEAAQDDLARRKITAPLGGMVVEVQKRAGEWAHPGDTVLTLLRLDTLRVEGFVSAAEHGPQEIAGRRVRVVVFLERGRTETFHGKIVFVNPHVQQPGGDYKVWAEVENRFVADQWVLRPGHNVEMTIDLAGERVARQPQPQ
jgi:multidrug efflux pump subunit AcrA (membrane-fusion protein)